MPALSAGFGGNLNAYELMRAMIAAGAAGVHFEDQLASAKKCGHMGGKVSKRGEGREWEGVGEGEVSLGMIMPTCIMMQ